MKKCKACNLDKDHSHFYKHPKNKDGHFTRCKKCMKEKRDNNTYAIF